MAKKLRKAIIKNYLSLKDVEVEFGNLTAITGPTNHGKSSIYRAIKWALYNVPSGDKFIRDIPVRNENGEIELDDLGNPVMKKAGMCYVELVFDDGTSIIRKRNSGSVNKYILRKEGEELGDIELDGFGMGPVDEVVSFHGMREVDFLDSKGGVKTLNMSDQLSPPFYLSETASTKAVMIGKMAKTEVVDLAIKNNAKDLKAEKAKLKEKKEQLKEVKEEMKSYKGLNKMEKEIGKLKKKKDKIDDLVSSFDKITKANDSIKTLIKKKESIEETIRTEDAVNKVMDIINEAERAHNLLEKITSINDALKKNVKRRDDLYEIINNINSHDIDKVINNCDKIIENSKLIREIRDIVSLKISSNERLEKLKALMAKDDDINKIYENTDRCLEIFRTITQLQPPVKKLNNYKNRLEEETDELKLCEKEFDESLKTYKSALKEYGKCPVCTNSITEDLIDNITI